MPNQPDFLNIRQFDLENKLIVPTTQLYKQISFQLNSLYQDICTALINAHTVIAAAGKQVYDQPVVTLTAWYEQAVAGSTALYATAQTTVLPVYHDWQVKVNVGKEKTGQYLQAFWENPEQVTLATLEPITRYISALSHTSESYWQDFIKSPEQFLLTAIAPISHNISALSDHAQAVIVSQYYALAGVLKLLIAQPANTLQAFYYDSVSALLEVYANIVSSFLVMT